MVYKEILFDHDIFIIQLGIMISFYFLGSTSSNHTKHFRRNNTEMPERIMMSSSNGIASNMERLRNSLQPTSGPLVNVPFLSSISSPSLINTTEMSAIGRHSSNTDDRSLQNTLKAFDGSFVLRPSGNSPFDLTKSTGLNSTTSLLASPFNFHPASVPSIYANATSRIFPTTFPLSIDKMSQLSSLLKSPSQSLNLKNLQKERTILPSQMEIYGHIKSQSTSKDHFNKGPSMFNQQDRSPSPTDGKCISSRDNYIF